AAADDCLTGRGELLDGTEHLGARSALERVARGADNRLVSGAEDDRRRGVTNGAGNRVGVGDLVVAAKQLQRANKELVGQGIPGAQGEERSELIDDTGLKTAIEGRQCGDAGGRERFDVEINADGRRKYGICAVVDAQRDGG